ncbi:MAG: lytic transglycosylase domain-containing protein [Opitutales bacterium]
MMFSQTNRVVLAGLLLPLAALGAEPPAPAPPPPSLQELYDTGKDLFDTLAPPEIKEQFEFPSKEQWDEFAGRLQHALDHDSLPDLARYEPEARAALLALRALPGYEDYADWLQERLDYIEAARQAAAPPALRPPEAAPTAASIPYLALWRARLQSRPVPAGATRLMPMLRQAFNAEGVPPALAWMAETESTLNPNARSPSGARGLFQLMPDTAKAVGLSTFLPDERTDPAKSARAAARLLHQLHDRFGSWPLALAAYNAGAGRVQRALDREHATTFAQIASTLPSETRMYVPKVLATLELRAGVNPGQLDRPGA